MHMKRLPAFAVVFVLAACQAPRETTVEPDPWTLPPLCALQEGATTREQALSALGKPSASFQMGQILTWRLVYETPGRIHSLPAQVAGDQPELADFRGVDFSLVIAFDSSGVLKAKRLAKVSTWAP